MFKNEEGFSLLELVVAVGVAGIIAAVALPTFAGLQDKATTTSATYAASASAAEALANSTIGNTGGNGSASTTGGASSSTTSGTLSFSLGNGYGFGQMIGNDVSNGGDLQFSFFSAELSAAIATTGTWTVNATYNDGLTNPQRTWTAYSSETGSQITLNSNFGDWRATGWDFGNLPNATYQVTAVTVNASTSTINFTFTN